MLHQHIHQVWSLTTAMKVTSDLGVGTLTISMAEWRFVLMASGAQCVMMAGMLGMLPQCVDNLDTVTLVTMSTKY